MRQRLWCGLLLLVGCGGDDAPPDAPGNVPAMVTITGKTTARSTTSMPLGDVTIGAYRTGSDATPLATTMSDAMGNYTLVVPTNMQALDGYLKASFGSYLDTYLYPPTIITGDMEGASMYLITSGTRDLLANTLCAGNQTNDKGAIAVLVVDAQEMAVAEATVSSSPAATKYCYNEGGYPNKNATATDPDGVAYMLNVTGEVTVSASKSGLTFTSHKVTARAGALTTTVIQP